MERNCLNTAVGYARRGWSVIPIPYRSKNPDRPRWDQLRLVETDLMRHFGPGPRNIGVLLGRPSGGLVDVDLDHELAVARAQEYLPSTGAIFGRAGKPRSHWLYRVSQPATTQQWRLPNRKMVVELRSTGGQTVFPGSVHPVGERIEWVIDGEPAVVDPNVLRDSLTQIFEEVCRHLGVNRREDAGSNIEPSAIAAPTSVIQRAGCYLAKLPSAVSGQGGHDATFRAACVLTIGFGLGRDQALALLKEWNERCQPPWTDKELEHKIDDALRKPGWRGHLLVLGGPNTRRSTHSAIERANRHAIEHRRRARRRART